MQRFLFTIPFLLLSCLFVEKLYAANVAYQRIQTDRVTFGVWYPNEDEANQTKLGIYVVEKYAHQGKLARRVSPYSLVILSHGAYGRYLNHRISAAFLARQGFIVAVPQHTQDNKMASGDLKQALQTRMTEINATFNTLINHRDFGKYIDENKAHAIGYSLGSAAVLATAGVAIDTNLIRQHCDTKAKQDAGYCHYSKRSAFSRKIPILRQDNALPFQKIVLIAPIGQGYAPDAFKNLQQDVLVVSMRDDQILSAQFHLEELKTLLPKQRSRYQEAVGHHFAFVGPFPKWLLEQQNIPAAKDPPWFNRLQAIKKINQMLLAYLKP